LGSKGGRLVVKERVLRLAPDPRTASVHQSGLIGIAAAGKLAHKMASKDDVRTRLEAAAEVYEERRDYALLPDARRYLEELLREAAARMAEEGRTSEADITLAEDRLRILMDEAAGNQMAFGGGIPSSSTPPGGVKEPPLPMREPPPPMVDV
jgi:hypothetical protein